MALSWYILSGKNSCDLSLSGKFWSGKILIREKFSHLAEKLCHHPAQIDQAKIQSGKILIPDPENKALAPTLYTSSSISYHKCT